jgi:MFS superfamily sulfate permease-like transporter
MQILFALFKGSVISYLFPGSVVRGMLVSIGLILILKQITHLLGIDKDAFSYHEIDLFFTLDMVKEIIASIHPGVAILSASSLIIFYTWTWLTKKYPNPVFDFISAPLLVVIAGVFINNFVFTKSFIIADNHLLDINLAGGFAALEAMFIFPAWDSIFHRNVWQVAVTLAIIASLESLLSVDAADKLSNHRMNSNRDKELLAQGAGNIISGVLGGLPLTAVIVRTSANIHSGAQTRLSTIFHGFWLILFIVAIPKILSLLPLASLSVILFATGFKLASVDIFKQEIKRGFERAIPFFTTILFVFLFDLLVGIFVGLLVGITWQVYRFNKGTVSLTQDDNYFLLKFEKDATFMIKPKINRLLGSIPENSNLTIACSDGVNIDDDVIELLTQYRDRSKQLRVDVTVKKSNLSKNKFFKGE